MINILLISFLFLFSSCTSYPSQESGMPVKAPEYSQKVLDIVTVCSGGSSLSKEARVELAIKLTKILQGEGAIEGSGKIEDALKGIDFDDKDLTNPTVVESQKVYTKCVSDNMTKL